MNPASRAARSFLIILIFAGLTLVCGQAPTEKTNTVIRRDAALVTVDIIAVDKQGAPIQDLHENDIKVTENGKEQKVLHFEHVSSKERRAPSIDREGWTNNVVVQQQHSSGRASAILLLDTLNIDPHDEARARKVMIETLESFPLDQQVAVFLLGNRLKQLTGFTDDPKLLHAVIEKASLKHSSTLDMPNLVTEVGIKTEFAEKDPSGKLEQVAEMLHSLEAFEMENISSSVDLRVKLTADALNQIASSCGGVPGRKNLVWISDSFPLNISPTGVTERTAEFNVSRNYALEIRKISARLTAARVAVYPVKIEGLQSYDKAEQAMPTFNPQTVRAPNDIARQYSTVFDASGTKTLVQHQASIDTIQMMAEETGGRAYFNTNNFMGAINSAMADGRDYYAIDYTPPNARGNNSAPRTIEIKTSRKGVQLRYRRAYIPGQLQEGGAAELEQALDPTLPVRDEIEIAADSRACNGNLLSLAVAAKDLLLGRMKDGRQAAQLSLGYMAVPLKVKDAIPMRSMRELDIPLDDSEVQRTATSGVPITIRLELPEGEYRTRVGIYDRNSRRIGSIDVDFTNKPCSSSEVAMLAASGVDENLQPEEGQFRGGVYENRYFGMRLELPKAFSLKQQRLEVMPQGVHALLALRLENRLHNGFVTAYASDASSGETLDAIVAARREVEKAAKAGRTVVYGPSERVASGERYWALLEKGPEPNERTLLYFIPRKSALLKLAATTDDDELFKNMSVAMSRLSFTDRRIPKSEGAEYFGPSIPDRSVEEALAKKPGAHLNDAGEISATNYKNASLGLNFAVPDGWSFMNANDGERLYERMHTPEAEDKSAVREHLLFRACSKPLFFMRRGSEEGSMETASLFLVEQACLKIHFPVKDEIAPMGEFASALSLFHDFGEARSAGMVKIDERPFVTIRGELAFAGDDLKLQRRRWQTAYVTAVGDKLLVWLWSYPHKETNDTSIASNIRLK